ncbi:hypothetical protein [Nostoc sp. 'Peltigera malacea cyanobiont' DB3992]|uniref:hypothetical protein n=1 Tax=Nostoc sp. 'Peltigera malacea cyanobiont' DB3992 TaxID=1206980 RepID=UPI0011807363|nr:hypothetical protein [Nostoc sp. 'Peltigera malacea cyanobiont' DB3992]
MQRKLQRSSMQILMQLERDRDRILNKLKVGRQAGCPPILRFLQLPSSLPCQISLASESNK